jgi:single-strand DNA-binding protein
MNKVILLGNLGADPEMKTSQSGTSIMKIRLATTSNVKKNDAWEKVTEWHSVTVFGKRAEGLAKVLAKGSMILVEGSLRTSSYEKDGVKHYKTEVVADSVELAGGRRDDAGARPQAPRPQSTSRDRVIDSKMAKARQSEDDFFDSQPADCCAEDLGDMPF